MQCIRNQIRLCFEKKVINDIFETTGGETECRLGIR